MSVPGRPIALATEEVERRRSAGGAQAERRRSVDEVALLFLGTFCILCNRGAGAPGRWVVQNGRSSTLACSFALTTKEPHCIGRFQDCKPQKSNWGKRSMSLLWDASSVVDVVHKLSVE